MILENIFLILFCFLFIYGFIRPFTNIYSRLFLILGSLFGFLSVLGAEYTNVIADLMGLSRGADLYLYMGLIITFLFTALTLEKFNIQQAKISKLVQKIAILEVEINKKK